MARRRTKRMSRDQSRRSSAAAWRWTKRTRIFTVSSCSGERSVSVGRRRRGSRHVMRHLRSAVAGVGVSASVQVTFSGVASQARPREPAALRTGSRLADLRLMRGRVHGSSAPTPDQEETARAGPTRCRGRMSRPSVRLAEEPQPADEQDDHAEDQRGGAPVIGRGGRQAGCPRRRRGSGAGDASGRRAGRVLAGRRSGRSGGSARRRGRRRSSASRPDPALCIGWSGLPWTSSSERSLGNGPVGTHRSGRCRCHGRSRRWA